MPTQKLRNHLQQNTTITVLTELTGGPGFKVGPIESFLKQAQSTDRQDLPQGFDFVGVALPQSPGGIANSDPLDVIMKLKAQNLLEGLDIIPHITCKDHNLNAIKSTLIAYRNLGIESILALTGDKPVAARGVFELESVGLLDLIQQMNCMSMLQAKPEQWDTVPQFLAGAAVSPFKYTEASQMQQYYKMEKKISRGAAYLITQLGWDWRKSQELMFYLRDHNIQIPVIGNVYLLTTQTPAPRLMHTGKLPGCFVSDDLYEKLQGESFEDHVERAAQQVAMYRDLGAAGVDIGGLPDYETFRTILTRAHAIGKDWELHRNNLYWPRKDGFYLYDEAGKPLPLSKPRRTMRQKSFNFFHNHFFTRDRVGTNFARSVVRLIRADRENSTGHHALTAMEKFFKYLAFNCEDCGDCYLPENFGYCTMGRCEKGLNNAPCGDSTADGHCGNNMDSPCTGELIYQAAAAEDGGRARLRSQVHAPRNPALQNSPSWINFLCARDHTRTNPLHIMGEAILAQIPNTRAALIKIATLGEEAWTRESGPLNYLKALIQSQAMAGADTLTTNLDALDETLALSCMTPCVRLVHQWGRSIPICISSQSYPLIEAGLRAWYDAEAAVDPPLIRWHQTDQTVATELILQQRETYPFRIAFLLNTGSSPTEQPTRAWIDQQHEQARQLYRQAVKTYGFQPQDIIFECPVLPLAQDLPENPHRPSQTHLSFETLKRIRNDKTLAGVHGALEAGPAAFKLPRAIGVSRAYIAKAMEYGMTTCWTDAQRRYGLIPADGKILALVDAFAKMDGSPEARQLAGELMDRFRHNGKKPGSPAPQVSPKPKTSIQSVPKPTPAAAKTKTLV